MGKITLIADDLNSRAAYLASCPLPDNYMADFTLLGLLVNDYRQSLHLLHAAGFSLIPHGSATEVVIEAPAHIGRIRNLLAAEGITSELSDIADSIYQA